MADRVAVAKQQGVGRRLVLYLVPPAGAALTFGTTLVAAQRCLEWSCADKGWVGLCGGDMLGKAAGAAVGISCASPVLASLMGCIAICSASAATAQVSYSLRKLCSQEPFKQEDPFLSKESLLVNALFGVIAFKVLGGRCCNLMPSNIVKPGAQARASIPARGAKYANEVEQGLIQDLYQRHGCHHCGKRAGDSIADHMPPNRIAYGRRWASSGSPQDSSFLAKLATAMPLPGIAPKLVQQRFYPQCTDCMKIQSAALRHGKKALVFHFRRGMPEVKSEQFDVERIATYMAQQANDLHSRLNFQIENLGRKNLD